MEEALEEEVSHQVLQEDPSVVEVHLEEEALQEASKYNSVQFGDGTIWGRRKKCTKLLLTTYGNGSTIVPVDYRENL